MYGIRIAMASDYHLIMLENIENIDAFISLGTFGRLQLEPDSTLASESLLGSVTYLARTRLL